jgi:transcriptional regulator with XRE-family HTH domain
MRCFTPLVLRFKERREYLGISNKKVAKIFGMDTHTISNWELGKHQPSAENSKKIELFLNIKKQVIPAL